MMPAGIGSSNASVGSGFKEVDGKKYLKLHWKDDAAGTYDYSVRENGTIYNDTTNSATEYSVDGEYNLYKMEMPCYVNSMITILKVQSCWKHRRTRT